MFDSVVHSFRHLYKRNFGGTKVVLTEERVMRASTLDRRTRG